MRINRTASSPTLLLPPVAESRQAGSKEASCRYQPLAWRSQVRAGSYRCQRIVFISSIADLRSLIDSLLVLTPPLAVKSVPFQHAAAAFDRVRIIASRLRLPLLVRALRRPPTAVMHLPTLLSFCQLPWQTFLTWPTTWPVVDNWTSSMEQRLSMTDGLIRGVVGLAVYGSKEAILRQRTR